MIRESKKTIFLTALSLLLLIIANVIDNFFAIIVQTPEDYNHLADAFFFTLSSSIYIALIICWIVLLNKRIMQNNLRLYLIALGLNIAFWVTIRVVKFTSFQFLIIADRLSWYAYYIPLTLIPLLFFFIALSVDRDENYRPSKKWNLLFVPALVLIFLVFTNDFHKLFFIMDFDSHAYGRYYDYGIGYFLYLVYFALLCIATVFLLVKKSRKLNASGKIPFLPILVLIFVILYTIVYIIDYQFIGAHFDFTIFSCISAVFFFEACIITRLIPSNKNYDLFFKTGGFGAQIYDKNKIERYSSDNSPSFTEEELDTLWNEGSLSKGASITAKISPISGGFVSYLIDTSEVDNLIERLSLINGQLHEDVRLLNIEKNQREETLYINEQREIQNKIYKDMLPYTAKILERSRAMQNSDDLKRKQLLYEISFIGAFIKRTVNLILLSNTVKALSAKELFRAFEELFSVLKFSGCFCASKIIKDCDISFSTAIFSFAFFDAMMELFSYKLDMIYITFDNDEDSIKIAFQISGDIDNRIYSLYNFTDGEGAKFCNKIEITPETDGYYIALHLSREEIL